MSYFSLFQSPHPARGATMISTSATSVNKKFQSTHPARGATSSMGSEVVVLQISIHAPREGCDQAIGQIRPTVKDFNPRTPRGGRLVLDEADLGTVISIHAPREGCDPPSRRQTPSMLISIHAPREGCDLDGLGWAAGEGDFNPRTPRGVRRR